MSTPPEELPGESSPIDADPGASSSSSASSSGSTSGSDPGGSSSSSRSSSSDSRRVAPKWLGKKIGRFRLQGFLGQGAVGRVFRAEDNILHRRVALKVITLHSDSGQINRNADQFLTEARAAAALEHPNVVQIYEAGETGNLCYIAMELLDGGSLKDLVVAGGPMDPGRACLLTADAAEALAAGHEAGIIHRDVKPANLMLSRQGRCKVTDFGLATFGDADSVSTEKAAGTPLFAAPEVIRGTSADERSDIYSLGATLYYLLTGRPPFTAKTRADVLKAHVNEPIPDLRVVRPGLPESLVAAVERSLDKDPGQRFQSATQFARVLRVQTIPTAPVAGGLSGGPSSGVTIGGASVLNLSGLTAVAGHSSGRLGTAAHAVGQASAADLATGGRRAAAPQGVDYASPSRVPRPWYQTPAVLVPAVVVAVAGFTVVALLLVRTSAGPRQISALPAVPVPLAASPPPPPVPVAPPRVAAAVTRPAATAARLTAVAVTDLARLSQVARDADAGLISSRIAVTGTVADTVISGSGKTVRLEFAGTPFAVVYFDSNGLYDRMDAKFGPHASNLTGRTIRATGRAKMYGKYPELILGSADQITVVADP